MTMPRTVIFLIIISVLAGCNQIRPATTSPLATADSSEPLPLSPESMEDLCLTDQSQLNKFVPADYDNVWDRIRAGYTIEFTDNARIQQHQKWYAKNTRYMKRVSERAERYLFYIVTELENHNMPLELALLPIVESAFDPFAYSHGRASGMWQFIPSTGKNFGLKQNWWYDGRRDIEASTGAAIKYLSYLSRRFDGDWLLALAAYNTGEGNVSKAIKRNKRAGKPTDFWSLSLPRETRAYVPQLLALANLIGDSEHYKIPLHDIPNQPYFARVEVNSQIDLAQAADLAEMDIDQLYLLNAGFNRWATDPQGPHHLLLPMDKTGLFIDKLNAIPANERIGWERYRVKGGDSLLGISKHFNSSVSSLKEANNLRGNLIREGQMLLIPVATKPAKHYAYSADQRLRRKQDNSKGKKGSNKIIYRVKPGDSFWKIARTYKVSVSSLARWNGMAPKDPLQANQKLVVWAADQRITEVKKKQRAGNSIIRKVAYQVRRGDSLARIAGKFNLSINDIVRWNPIKKSSYIHPGQSLILFVDVTSTN